MEVYNNELYVAGLFMSAWGNIDNSIIRYDGVNWKPVGGGFTSSQTSWTSVYNLRVIDNELYAVGYFDYAGGIPAQNLAKWNGLEWCGFTTMSQGALFDVAKLNNDLYVGGSFLEIGGDSIRGIAKYIGIGADTCGFINVGLVNDAFLTDNIVLIYPNPANNKFTISLSENSNYSFEIYNSIGKIFSQGFFRNQTEINSLGWQSGMYFIRVTDGKNIWNEKIIKQ
jgi:hypothetical protein